MMHNNVKYIGKMIGTTRSGFGMQYWNDGANYIGIWLLNKAN